MSEKKKKNTLGKIWYFIWEDDSLLSWIVNIILAFILVKFIIYPGLGFILGTSYPVVAVVSGSMEHDEPNFEEWWEQNRIWYGDNDITKDEFKEFNFKNGFNEGDIMVLYGTEPEDIKIGHVIVYASQQNNPPIIHRVVSVEKNGDIFFRTKGDHNIIEDKEQIPDENYLGRAVLRIPYLGWVKISFTHLIQFIMRITPG